MIPSRKAIGSRLEGEGGEGEGMDIDGEAMDVDGGDSDDEDGRGCSLSRDGGGGPISEYERHLPRGDPLSFEELRLIYLEEINAKERKKEEAKG